MPPVQLSRYLCSKVDKSCARGKVYMDGSKSLNRCRRKMSTMNGPSVLMVGTGEYTTGYVHGEGSASDKGCGVVALTMFDLRRRGLVGDRLLLCGTTGTKFPGMREHIQQKIGEVYTGMDVGCETFPADDVERDGDAYKAAMKTLTKGDIVTIFTPDDTHFQIALECIEAGLHVLVTKPIVKTLEDHRLLAEAAARNNVLVAIEVHKRWDPMYEDARNRSATLGDFSYMYAYMSQPKLQLNTFRAWAGKSSDISYYLNSHHVDWHCWTLAGKARPLSVQATASTGVAKEQFDIDTEDTITLTVQWQNIATGHLGTAVYTSSWIAPTSDVHSQQRFHYMGQKGEVQVDQAHRGYSMATDGVGFRTVNPLFMKYTPDAESGEFAGQHGYGYRSFETFVRAVADIRSGKRDASFYNQSQLATVHTTFMETAILEGGRRSLDNGGKSIRLEYDTETSLIPRFAQ